MSDLSIKEAKKLLILEILKEWKEQHGDIPMHKDDILKEFNIRWEKLIKLACEGA